ncbi:MAG TPA: hypothetical protein VFP10_10540, partial [Candidatus Eisenbacteria bacterium]|nr:hypothetical protein [Candidatus Eisenbacteria bacterium]
MSLPSRGLVVSVVCLVVLGSRDALAAATPRFQAAWKTGTAATPLPTLTPADIQENQSWEDRFYRSGIDGPAFALFSYQGKLIAGGAFQQA